MKQQSGFSAVEVLIVLAVVGVIGAVGWMVLGKNNEPDSGNNTENATTQPVATESGTCFGVSKATIKSLLGAPAANLQDLSDTGVKDIGKGDKAQTCVYPFAPGATSTNSFTIDLGTYANQANLDASQQYIPSNGASVEGLGDSATYEAKDAAISNSRDFVLTIRQDLKIYKFGISQPQDALTYNDASAQRVLIQIAQAATL
jgi:prepilin-type N-terminal cleavage/methylation domain-containing protein